MTSEILIYGAYGYTGDLIARKAVERGLRPTLAGRDERQTTNLAEELGLNWKCFALNDIKSIDAALRNVGILLNCAGPFSKTAKQLMEACVRNKVHYLDITGEIQVFELAHKMDPLAKAAGVLLLPGVGFDVVPSDCLAALVAKKLPGATDLELSFTGGAGFSQGTALTMAENIHHGGAIRQNGEITAVPHAYQTKYVRFDEKERLCVTIPWGDISTAFYSTGIPNIKVFIAQPPAVVRMLQTIQSFRRVLGWKPIQRLIKKYIHRKIKGPTESERNAKRSFLHAVATNASGGRVEARLVVPEGYSLTAITAVMAVERLQAGSKSLSGFLTPSLAFGHHFILEVEGVKLYE